MNVLDRKHEWKLGTPRQMLLTGRPIEMPDGSGIALVIGEKNPDMLTAAQLMSAARELNHALLMAVDFIENVTDEDPERTDKFFACREAWRAAFLKTNP